jgi:hypothetical protein
MASGLATSMKPTSPFPQVIQILICLYTFINADPDDIATGNGVGEGGREKSVDMQSLFFTPPPLSP